MLDLEVPGRQQVRTPESHLRRLWASEAACPLGSASGTSAEDGRGDEAEKLRISSSRRLGDPGSGHYGSQETGQSTESRRHGDKARCLARGMMMAWEVRAAGATDRMLLAQITPPGHQDGSSREPEPNSREETCSQVLCSWEKE